MSTRIYLDYNASPPIDHRVWALMCELGTSTFGNASSVHTEGRRAREATEAARAQVAEAAGVEPAEVIFTSSATEANHLGIVGAAMAAPAQRRRIVASAIEHPCATGAVEQLGRRGFDVAWIPAARSGRVSAEAMTDAIDERTALVVLMLANNETGVVQPVASVAERARTCGALLHVDAAQALGRIPIDARALGADMLALSGSKAYAGRGSGALVVRRGVLLMPLFSGHQERGRRGGTENVIAIAGFGEAARLAHEELRAGEAHRQAALRDALWDGLARVCPGIERLGEGVDTLPNTLAVLVPGLNGEALVMALDVEGVAASSGAACTSGSTEPSRVLLAMGMSAAEARAGLRLSVGRSSTRQEIDAATAIFGRVVERVRLAEGHPAAGHAWWRWAEEEEG